MHDLWSLVGCYSCHWQSVNTVTVWQANCLATVKTEPNSVCLETEVNATRNRYKTHWQTSSLISLWRHGAHLTVSRDQARDQPTDLTSLLITDHDMRPQSWYSLSWPNVKVNCVMCRAVSDSFWSNTTSLHCCQPNQHSETGRSQVKLYFSDQWSQRTVTDW